MVKIKNIFSELLSVDSGLTKIQTILFVLIAILGIGFSAYYDVNLYVMAAFTTLPIFFIIVTYPKIWLYTVVVLFTLFFAKTDKELNVMEVIIALLYNGGLFLWFVWSTFIEKRKIVRNKADWIILFVFAVVLFGNSVLAVLNGVPIDAWLREFMLFSLTLFYFPFRHHFTEKKEIVSLLVILAISIFVVDFKQFYSYYVGITSDDIQYAYELGKSVRINQTVFTIASIFGFLFTFNQKNKKYEYLILIFTSVTVTALITSFSRTFWIILMFALILMFFFLSTRKKVKFLIYLSIVLSVIIGGAYIVAKDNLNIFIQYMENRITSSTKGRKDASLLSRLSEWDAVFDSLEYQWLSGNGLAKEFHFYNPINETTKRTTTIHNGYIYFVYRLGIPLTLMYLAFFTMYFYKSFILLKLVKDPFYTVLITATFGSILSMYIINLTSSQFVYRDGLFTVALLIAFTSIVEANYLKGKA